jgi:uncharacterized protein (DUF433 family)
MRFGADEIDWNGCELVERIPGKVSGRAIVRGTRILADAIAQDAELGSSLEEIQENYPDLSQSLIRRLLSFAQSRREHFAAEGQRVAGIAVRPPPYASIAEWRPGRDAIVPRARLHVCASYSIGPEANRR